MDVLALKKRFSYVPLHTYIHLNLQSTELEPFFLTYGIVPVHTQYHDLFAVWDRTAQCRRAISRSREKHPLTV